MFLSDQPKLTWVDASYACEQAMLVGSEELNPFQRLNLLFGEQFLAGPNGLKQFTYFIISGWWLPRRASKPTTNGVSHWPCWP